MPDEVSVRALKLHELLGATLVAVVQADALAAKATLEYIETVGFAEATESETEDSEAEAGGRLRMASFRYKKLDANNDVAEFVAEVPILSLVPIPALQIKDATLSFAVKIDDITKTTDGPTPTPTSAVAAAASGVGTTTPMRLLDELRPTATQLVARPAASSGAKSQEVRSTHHLELKVTMAQADIPVGMEKIFDLLDQAIQDRKAQ
jgi:Protein of unknown function (DUF2589)